MKKRNRRFKVGTLIKYHILNNKKIYIITLLIFIIGVFLGVLFINNVKEEEYKNITSYITDFIEKFKHTGNLDNINLLKNSIANNMIILIALWFLGTTVIRYTNSCRNYNL